MMKIETDLIDQEESESDREQEEEKKIQFEVEKEQVKRQQELQSELQNELKEKIVEKKNHKEEDEKEYLSKPTPRSQRERQMKEASSSTHQNKKKESTKKKTSLVASKRSDQLSKDQPSLVHILFREMPPIAFKSVVLRTKMTFSRIFIEPFFRAICSLVSLIIYVLTWTSSWGEDFFFRSTTSDDTSKIRFLSRFFSYLKEASEDLQDSKDTVKRNFSKNNKSMSDELQLLRKQGSDLKEIVFDISYKTRSNQSPKPQNLSQVFDLFLLSIFHLGLWISLTATRVLVFLRIRSPTPAE